MLRLVTVAVVALAVVASAVLNLQLGDRHADGVLVLRVFRRRLSDHLDPVAGCRQVTSDPAHRHDRSREGVDGAHHGQVLSDVLHDPGLGRAANVRLVLDVDRSVEIKMLRYIFSNKLNRQSLPRIGRI